MPNSIRRDRGRSPMLRAWFGPVALLLLVAPANLGAQSRVLIGRVIDSSSAEPVDHGLIRVMGTPIQAQIQKDGSFILYVPEREVTLSFESKEYHRTEVAVAQQVESLLIPVHRDYFELSTVVVTGQGTGVRRRNLANSVGQVSGEDLSRTPAPSVDDALRGKVSGANITRHSGAPGGGITMRLRGVTTILGNADP